MQAVTSLPVFKRIIDFDKWRWYYRDGELNAPSEWFASVTNILRIAVPNYLKNYMMKTSPSKQQKRFTEASQLGIKAHTIIESDLTGKPVVREDLEPEVQVILDGWIRVKREHKISARLIEAPIGSLRYGFAGTCDIVGTADGQPCMIDLKTGNFDKKVGLQLAAYRGAWQELTGESLGMAGVSIRAQEAWETHKLYADTHVFRYGHVPYCWSAFLSCFNTWKSIHATKLNRMNWKYRGLHAVPEAPWGN